MSGAREQRRNGAAFQWASDVQKLAEGDTIKGGFRLCRCEQLLCVRVCVDRQLTSTLGADTRLPNKYYLCFHSLHLGG